MERFIISDLLKYIISDYVGYPHILYTQNLKLNNHRTRNEQTIKNMDNINPLISCNITTYIDNNIVKNVCTISDIKNIITITGIISTYVTFEKDRLQTSYSIKNGRKHGKDCIYDTSDEYYLEGQNKLHFKKYYYNDKLNGKFIKYGDRNNYMIGNYINDSLDGPFKIFNNDILITDGFYKNDKLTGMCRHWYTDGTLKSLLNYCDGKLDGYNRYYDSDGELYNLVYYADNTILLNINTNIKPFVADKKFLFAQIKELFNE
jgi:antitoxin component YwqK of YwqJK toxin-antitoxin module